MKRDRYKQQSLFKKLKKKVGNIVWLIIVAVLVSALYFGGIITQVTAMSLLMDGDPITFNFVKCIAINFNDSWRGFFIVIFLYAIAGATLIKKEFIENIRDRRDDDRGFQTETSGEYGQNAIMGRDEARDYFEIEPESVFRKRGGFIIGREIPEKDAEAIIDKRIHRKQNNVNIVSVSADGKRIQRTNDGKRKIRRTQEGKREFIVERMPGYVNGHVMAVGGSGSGKTYNLVLTNTFAKIEKGESLLITDPKGEIYQHTQQFAIDHGYIVKVLNFVRLEHSDSWDVIGEMEKTAENIEVEIGNVCQIIIDNTSDPNGKTDIAFQKSEHNLLIALMYYIVFEMPREKKKLGELVNLLDSNTDEELNELFETSVHRDRIIGYWGAYYNGSPNLRGNVRQGMSNRLLNLRIEAVKAVTGIPDIDLTLPAREKCIYYIIVDDMNTQFRFISSLFFTSTINAMVYLSRARGNRASDIPITFILDEFSTIGGIPDFDAKISMVRSAGLNMICIFQSIAQLMRLYPNYRWETIVANCGTQVLLRSGDPSTTEYFSNRSGEATIKVETTKVSKPIMDQFFMPSNWDISQSVNKRAVLTKGEINTLPETEFLVFATGADPYFVKKLPWTEIVDAESIDMSKTMGDHAPLWREKQRIDVINDIRRYQTPAYAETRKERRDTQVTTNQQSTVTIESQSSDNENNDRVPSGNESAIKGMNAEVVSNAIKQEQHKKQAVPVEEKQAQTQSQSNMWSDFDPSFDEVDYEDPESSDNSESDNRSRGISDDF